MYAPFTLVRGALENACAAEWLLESHKRPERLARGLRLALADIRHSEEVSAEGIDFPHVTQIARIRRDRYDIDGALISKEIVHAVTSLSEDRASAAGLARIARGRWGIESVHWIRDTAYAEDASTGYAGNGPQAMATLRNLAVSLLYLAGVTEITRTLQAIGRDRNRMLSYLPI